MLFQYKTTREEATRDDACGSNITQPACLVSRRENLCRSEANKLDNWIVYIARWLH